MADTTQVTMNVQSTPEATHAPVDNLPRNNNGYLSKPYAEYTSSQKLQIELNRLKFLKDCKSCKRPPPSLRIRGASAVKNETKFKKFSIWETELLDEAIKDKMSLTKHLKKTLLEEENQLLSEEDNKQMVDHFQKKLTFYISQNKNKWKDWPNKTGKKKKTEANFKRKQRRRKRKTEENAKRALETGSVVIMIEEDIPPGSISLLGKGLGYTPTPKTNIREEQLDMRLATNRILQTANMPSEQRTNVIPNIPSKLTHRKFTASKPAKENFINNIVDNITEEHNGRLQFENEIKRKKNITKDEEEGLRWLIKATQESRIAVVKADKGGAILIVKPELLEEAVIEKLENPNLYQKLHADPTDELHNELFNLWVIGKKAGFVSAYEASKVMGVTENNNKTTLSHLKPGTSYFYPMLKIHKLKKEDLKPGIKPPSRLVTALQEGISKRSDVFVADRFLKELESIFCKDLLKDTNGALLWLDSVNESYSVEDKKKMKAFTFDFKSLYDNLSPELVKEAVHHAMSTCKPGWSKEKQKWILDLIELSLRASIGKYKNHWYLQRNGVPTGGSICVQLANITVFYLMNKAVYSKPKLMCNVKESKRYIDDGAGFYVGSERSFKSWMNSVNNALRTFGLYIDESGIKDVDEFVPFLDILFCFDKEGNLQTDLHVKPTDARSYLNYRSAHPRHIFSGIVYSQCLRLHRIINNKDRLKNRLNELCVAFEKSGYPRKMLTEISDKVYKRNRELHVIPSTHNADENSKPILVISQHGTDDRLVKSLKRHEDDLLKTNSFKNSRKPLFQFVKKIGPNLASKLSVLKSLALGEKRGKTVPCNGHLNCKCCHLIAKEEVSEINGLSISSAPGNCKTRKVIYLVECVLCFKPYIGRTTQMLSKRMNGHRKCYYKLLDNEEDIDFSKDDYSLGLHLKHEHGCSNPTEFDRHYKIQILEICSPSLLEKKEHNYIHGYNTLYPIGLNKFNPFGLTRLCK